MTREGREMRVCMNESARDISQVRGFKMKKNNV